MNNSFKDKLLLSWRTNKITAFDDLFNCLSFTESKISNTICSWETFPIQKKLINCKAFSFFTSKLWIQKCFTCQSICSILHIRITKASLFKIFYSLTDKAVIIENNNNNSTSRLRQLCIHMLDVHKLITSDLFQFTYNFSEIHVLCILDWWTRVVKI